MGESLTVNYQSLPGEGGTTRGRHSTASQPVFTSFHLDINLFEFQFLYVVLYCALIYSISLQMTKIVPLGDGPEDLWLLK